MPSETSDEEPRRPAIGRDVFRMLQELELVPGPPAMVTGVDIRIRADELVEMQVTMIADPAMMTALLPELTSDNIEVSNEDRTIRDYTVERVGARLPVTYAALDEAGPLTGLDLLAHVDEEIQSNFEQAVLYGIDERTGLPNPPPDEDDGLPIPGAYIESCDSDDDDDDESIYYARCESCDFEGRVGLYRTAARSANRHNASNHPVSPVLSLTPPEATDALDASPATIHHSGAGWWAQCHLCTDRSPFYRVRDGCVDHINNHLIDVHEHDDDYFDYDAVEEEDEDYEADAIPLAPLPDGHIETRTTTVTTRTGNRDRTRHYGVCDICNFETVGGTQTLYSVRRLNRHLAAQHPNSTPVALDEGHGEDDEEEDEDW